MSFLDADTGTDMTSIMLKIFHYYAFPLKICSCPVRKASETAFQQSYNSKSQNNDICLDLQVFRAGNAASIAGFTHLCR